MNNNNNNRVWVEDESKRNADSEKNFFKANISSDVFQTVAPTGYQSRSSLKPAKRWQIGKTTEAKPQNLSLDFYLL